MSKLAGKILLAESVSAGRYLRQESMSGWAASCLTRHSTTRFGQITFGQKTTVQTSVHAHVGGPDPGGPYPRGPYRQFHIISESDTVIYSRIAAIDSYGIGLRHLTWH